jgi:cell division protein FtsL
VALLLSATAVASSAAICQVWTRLRAIDYGYKISRASREQATLLDANRRLRLEVAVLTNPARIARVATEELGLRAPTPEQIRRLRGPAAPPPPRNPLRGLGPAVARAVR